MVLDILMGTLPLTLGSAIAMLIESIIVTGVILLSDRVIAHNMEIKHAFIMAFAAYFIVPLFRAGITLAGFGIDIILLYPIQLLTWVILGELLLKNNDFMTKLQVTVVAFVIYLILQYAGALTLIRLMLPF
mgnify:CR=1 FL=1